MFTVEFVKFRKDQINIAVFFALGCSFAGPVTCHEVIGSSAGSTLDQIHWHGRELSVATSLDE